MNKKSYRYEMAIYICNTIRVPLLLIGINLYKINTIYILLETYTNDFL
jgi:hypothetical protein